MLHIGARMSGVTRTLQRGTRMWDIVTIIVIFGILYLGHELKIVFAKARASGWNNFPRR
ncbi:hypothetical protein JNB88_26620 [Rhizobium cauense]|uniref:hypothetical protein n=1 Tax=Rhizobium cauense TaxID=1166683 RepID=UPI001C6ECAE9|nr:hypothetical protein [Rhizobium cauense]MBW9117198.1 hypothetical protein [Rhizobium cauense]